MQFKSILMAMAATSAAVACPSGKKPATPPAGGAATPSSYHAPSYVPSNIPVASSSARPTTTTAAKAVQAAASSYPSSSSGSSSSSSGSSSSSISGEATFYGGNLSGGACSFTTLSTIPNSLYGTAYSGAVWDNAAECGACVKVTGPNGNSITAMIVDKCPECEESHLDLFEDAFTELGTKSAGIIDISYEFTSCGISSPLVLHNKSGTSEYWFSMQVVGASEAVDTLEVSTDGGSTWQSTTRSDYNFFENTSGFGTDTVEVRVTSSSGTTVTVNNVSCASESQTTASSNF